MRNSGFSPFVCVNIYKKENVTVNGNEIEQQQQPYDKKQQQTKVNYILILSRV